MIIIVDDRNLVTEAYRSSFRREGVPAAGFTSGDFRGWVGTAAMEDVRAVEAFLIGENADRTVLGTVKRRNPKAALIALKENKSLATTLELFAEGVDDVVTKPCHVREILARIEAIARRARAVDTLSLASDSATAIQIFRDGRDPLVAGEPLRLPRRELRILECLAANHPRRITKSQIFASVYGLFDQSIDETVIESHISKLRRRLRERLGCDAIESTRHLGYRLTCPASTFGS